jgi:hypothetical protein
VSGSNMAKQATLVDLLEPCIHSRPPLTHAGARGIGRSAASGGQRAAAGHREADAAPAVGGLCCRGGRRLDAHGCRGDRPLAAHKIVERTYIVTDRASAVHLLTQLRF